MVMRFYAQELRYGKIEDFIGKPLVLFLLRNSYFIIGTLYLRTSKTFAAGIRACTFVADILGFHIYLHLAIYLSQQHLIFEQPYILIEFQPN